MYGVGSKKQQINKVILNELTGWTALWPLLTDFRHKLAAEMGLERYVAMRPNFVYQQPWLDLKRRTHDSKGTLLSLH